MLDVLTIKEAYEAIKEGFIVKNMRNYIFKMRNKKVWVKSENATYTLSFKDFIKLYEDDKFIIFEDNNQVIDSKKDDEYYSFKHK